MNVRHVTFDISDVTSLARSGSSWFVFQLLEQKLAEVHNFLKQNQLQLSLFQSLEQVLKGMRLCLSRLSMHSGCNRQCLQGE